MLEINLMKNEDVVDPITDGWGCFFLKLIFPLVEEIFL